MSATRQKSIANVAKAAGVSTATVSRVLNNFPHVREETVRRVREAVQSLNYNPLRTRRDLNDENGFGRPRPGRTGNIAVITLGQAREWLQLPVMAAAVAGIRSAVTDRGYRMILDELVDASKPHRLIDRREIDGAIVFVTGDLPSEKCHEVLDTVSQKIPVVWAMGEEYGNYDVDHVTCDNVHIGHLAFDYLRSKNCGELAVIGLSPEWFFMRLRAQSFLNAAYDAKIAATAYVVSEDPMIVDSYGKRTISARTPEELVTKLAAAPNRPQGLFILNDQTTVALMPLLARHGFHPERDVTIISCDNEQSRLAGLHPRPATIDIRSEEVGYRAMVRLASRMRNPEETPLVVRVAAKLVPANLDGEPYPQ
jgi:DNA-binding LacI/PurR family transcriptional regulator